MIVCVVSAVDQVFPLAADEVRSIVSPTQIVVKAEAVTVGVAGTGLTVTNSDTEAELQPFSTTSSVILFPDVTVMDCVVSPVDHRLFAEADEVNTTEPPSQKVVAPPAVMDGTAGIGFIVTAVEADVAEQPVWVTVTKNEPAVVTVIACVVSPVDHMLPVAEEEVRTTDPPVQSAVVPPAVIVGVAGAPGSVNVAETVLEAHPFVKLKLYEPAPSPETVAGNVTPLIIPAAVPVQDKSPVPEPLISTDPSVAEHAVGLDCVPKDMEGFGLTVTFVVAEAEEVQPLTAVVTVTAAVLFTVMDCVVSPVDQVFPPEAEEVSTTFPPEQNVVAPPAVIVGVAGMELTVTFVEADVAEHPATVTVTK